MWRSMTICCVFVKRAASSASAAEATTCGIMDEMTWIGLCKALGWVVRGRVK